MGEALAIFFIFIAVTGVTVVLFGGWVIVMIAKGIGLLVRALFGDINQEVLSRRSCTECNQLNPALARFCRRCGHDIRGVMRTR